MRSRRRGLKRAIAIAILAAAAVFTTTSSASALDEPRVPQNVGQYFATALIPRLADLFGGKAGAEVVFDATAKVGGIHRVLSFTTAFLSGAKTTDPTQITNTWIAPVMAGDSTVAGVATVWINPASEQPELADFSSGVSLATALGAAPQGTLLIRDDAHSAWFATDGITLTPLVSGTSGVTAPTTLTAYQQKFTLAAPTEAAASPNRGLLIAVGVLGIVVVLLAIFVVLPDRRRRAETKGAPQESEVGPAPTDVTETAPDVVPDVEPEATTVKPVTAKPAMAKPATAKPAMVKPVTVKPAMAKPVTAKPAMAKPATANPAMAKPATGKPATAKPATAKPPTTKPVTTKPVTAKPASAKPGSAKRPPASGVSS